MTGKFIRLWLSMFMISTMLLATGCDEPPAYTYTDTMPPESTLRIISLSPALTRILVDLGQSEYIVGVGQNDDAAPAGAKVVGTYLDVNAELIMELNPTIVLTMSGRDGPPARLKELSVSHFMLVDYPYPQSPADVGEIIFRNSDMRATFGLDKMSPDPAAADADPLATPAVPVAPIETGPPSIGALLDIIRPAMSLKLTMLMRLGEISKLTSDKDRPSTLLVIGNSPVMASGPDTVLDQLLVLAGGRNAASESTSTAPTFDREMLLNLKPDVVLYFNPGGRPIEDFTNDPRLTDFRDLNIPAVLNKRIILIDDPMAMLPSSSLDQTAGMIAKALYPDLSGQIDRILKATMSELSRTSDFDASPAKPTPSRSSDTTGTEVPLGL